MKKKLFLLASICLFYYATSKAKEKTNIVLIIADDVSFDDMGCYGNKVVKTPNIDRLANEGMRFDNAFLVTSSSSPSRCSMITGKYPHSTGAAELHTPLPETEIPFPLLLKQHNYYTAQAGKWHMGPSVYRAFDRYTDNNGYDNGDGGELNWVRFLKEREQDKPFFLWLASHDAHRPWGADDFFISHDPNEVEVPLYFADTPETRGDIVSYYNEIARFDYYVGEVRKELERQGVFDNTIMIIMADNGRPFPRCKTRVYDSGMKTPFIVSWPKGMKQKGSVSNSLISSIDIAPTLLELAGVEIPKDMQGLSFSAILENPSAEIRNVVYAEHNWHDYEAYERMVRTKEYLYVFNGRPNLSNGGPADSKISPTQKSLNRVRDQGMLTAAQADIFMTPRPAEEFYDLSKDSLQIINVASHPRYQKELTELRRLFKSWQQETSDTMPENLTKDWFDRETGEPLKNENSNIRGTMPGKQ
jgi:arylsulfatase A-like enzyme